ncbi:MAG: oligosaccharide flippase family protein [Bacteroidota bacterium]
MNPADDGMRHIEAYGGTLLSRVLAAIATLSLHLLIARSVTPSEYGAVAFLVTTLAILLLVISFGNEPLLVREGGGKSLRALSVAVFALLLALLFAMGLSIFAAAIEGMLHIPGLSRLLMWGLPALPLQALQILPRAELLRKQEFLRLARTDARSSILAWLPAIVFFLLTKDIAAFALYLVTMHVLRAAAYWRISGLRPSELAAQEIRLGRYISGWRILSIDSSTFLTTRFDDLMVAANLGAAMLGIYHLCYRVITVVQEFFSGVMRVLSYPRYAMAAPDRAHVYRLFCADTRFVTAIMLPLLAAALVTADVLVPILLGSAWTNAVFIFQLLTLEAMRQALLSLGAQGLVALGDERRLLRFSLVSASVLLPTFVLLSFTDLHSFVIGFVAVNTILNVYFFQVLRSSFVRPLRPLLLAWMPGLIGSLIPLLFTLVPRAAGISSPGIILAAAAGGVLTVFAAYVLLAPDILRSMRRATGLQLKIAGSGKSRQIKVYVDGPFDEANPHLQRVYRTMQSFSSNIEIHPLHLRNCLHEAWKRRLQLGSKADHSLHVLHIHYPVFLYEGESIVRAVLRGLRSGLTLLLLRSMGLRFVFTLHDSGAHDFPHRRWERMYLTALCQAADAVTTLSEEGRRQLFAVFGRSQAVFVARHCSYELVDFSEQQRKMKREELGIAADECVFLLFGSLKPYKGYDNFVRACREITGIRIVLVCAGKGMAAFGPESVHERAEFCDPETLNETLESCGPETVPGGTMFSVPDHAHDQAESIQSVRAPGLTRTVILDRFIDAAEASALMDASDFGALPYRRILHSGTAILFASHACPVIAPRMGVFIEQERAYSIGLYYEPDSQEAMTEAIRAAAERGRKPFAASFTAFHTDHRLESEAQVMLQVYRSLSGEEVAA